MISMEGDSFARSLVDLSLDREFYKNQFSGGNSVDDLVEHYLNSGWREGYDPAPWFSTRRYLEMYPELLSGEVNPLVHYLLSRDEADAEPTNLAGPEPDGAADDYAMVRPEFDTVWYIGQIGVERADEIPDLVRHYMLEGWKEGFDPNPWFSTGSYLQAHPDVAEHGMNPFLHYILTGRQEGRALAPAGESLPDLPNSDVTEAVPEETEDFKFMKSVIEAEFNREFYLAKYPDIAGAGVDPLNHFMIQGWRENRDPNPYFSVQYYLSHSLDVAEAGINPFYHFLVAGRQEGRKGVHELGFRFDILNNLRSVEDQIADARKWAPQVAPIRAIDLADILSRFFSSEKPVVVSFSHDQFTKHVGGVQLCIRREMKQILEMGWSHFHLFPQAPQPVSAFESSPMLGLLLDGELAGFVKADVLLRSVTKIMAKTRRKHRFVIHSLLGHNIATTIALLRAFRISEGFFWLHDYASKCSNYKLMRNDVQYCGAPPVDSLACRVCEYGSTRMLQADGYLQLFASFKTHLLAPSQAALDILLRGSSAKFSSIRVLPHCTLSDAKVLEKSLNLDDDDGRLRVGFLGYPSDPKGWSVFRDLAVKYGRDSRYRFYHLGKGERVGLPVEYREVEARDGMLDMMTTAVSEVRLDVALVWALCPETFCLVAYEAISGGAMLVTNPDSGNVAALVRSGGHGLVIDNEEELSEAFMSGAILKLARKSRKTTVYDLTFSSLTASVIEEI